jgi:hypothetical protein
MAVMPGQFNQELSQEHELVTMLDGTGNQCVLHLLKLVDVSHHRVRLACILFLLLHMQRKTEGRVSKLTLASW